MLNMTGGGKTNAPEAPTPRPEEADTPRGALFPGGPDLISRQVEVLEPGEVFVFGSNAQGYHGLGAAGLAFRGRSGGDHANDPSIRRARAAPVGHPDRIGKWAIFGQAEGGMVGHEGKSYAVITVARRGAKCSATEAELQTRFLRLTLAARSRPALNFLVSALGAGLGGYSALYTGDIWSFVNDRCPLPGNMTFLAPLTAPAAPGSR